MKLYAAEFPRYHEQILLDCILIMEKECEHYITSTQRYGSDVQPLKRTLFTITNDKLVNLILDCTDTIRAKKNWNGHGATLGLAIYQLSLIISSLGKRRLGLTSMNLFHMVWCTLVINMETLPQFVQNT